MRNGTVNLGYNDALQAIRDPSAVLSCYSRSHHDFPLSLWSSASVGA
jgi:hypothetical protein